MKKPAILLCLLALVAFGLVACGEDEEETTVQTTEETTATDAGDEGAAGEGGTFAVAADPGGALEFTEEAASVPAGQVTVEFDNPSSTPHDVVIEDEGGDELARTEVITNGTTSTEAELAAGEYTFYCSVDAHREQGMEGALTVE